MSEEPEVEVIGKDTGEIKGTALVVQSDALPIEKVGDFIGLSDNVIKQFMKHGTDYDTIPGTKKPTLLKPGAEKLGMTFNLTPTYETLDLEEDHFKEFEYGGGKKARGFYFYRVRCILTHRNSGVVMADCMASCASTERGRETSPANTVLKIAQKRAYVGAILNATFSSDRFVADMDDTIPSGGPQARPESVSREVGPDTPVWFGVHGPENGNQKLVKDLPDDYLRYLVDKTAQHKDWAQAELDRRLAELHAETTEQPEETEHERLTKQIEIGENEVFDNETDIFHARNAILGTQNLDQFISAEKKQRYVDYLRDLWKKKKAKEAGRDDTGTVVSP